MFAHSVVSWTVEQSGCIFSVSIAGFQGSSTRRLAMDFECFCSLSLNYTYFTCRNFVCQHSVMVETTLKPRAFAFIVSNIQRYFSARKHQAKRHQWSCRDSARLRSPCGEVGTRSVSTVFPDPLISCHWVLCVSLQKCANLVTVRTEWRMRGTLVSSHNIRVVIEFVIDA